MASIMMDMVMQSTCTVTTKSKSLLAHPTDNYELPNSV
ncbi:hypothetical protein X777_07562 [Ooceraea biroi]|uniref:Uncharacterized protein n=1 Tax=Ooceraea biroi TaxID=2015173 RepID=A0A026X411_OOCBI|nr:hypothetical protein X777_07562 [Ooceraea biroi]